MEPPRRRRSRLVPVAAGGVVIAAGVAVGLAEALRFPRGSVWVVVGAAVLLLGLVRVLGRRL